MNMQSSYDSSASVENMSDIYAQDGGYASGRPSMEASSSSFPSSVPETIQQSYDADGGYQYWMDTKLRKYYESALFYKFIVMEPKKDT